MEKIIFVRKVLETILTYFQKFQLKFLNFCQKMADFTFFSVSILQITMANAAARLNDNQHEENSLTDVTLNLKDINVLTVHKLVLQAQSPMFRAMHSGNWAEASTCTVDFTEFEPHVCKLVINFYVWPGHYNDHREHLGHGRNCQLPPDGWSESVMSTVHGVKTAELPWGCLAVCVLAWQFMELGLQNFHEDTLQFVYLCDSSWS